MSEEALSACAFTVLHKPFEPDKVLELIEEAKKASECEKAKKETLIPTFRRTPKIEQ